MRPTQKEIELSVKVAELEAGNKRLREANDELLSFVEEDEITIKEIEKMHHLLRQRDESKHEDGRWRLGVGDWCKLIQPGGSERAMITSVDDYNIIFDRGVFIIRLER